MQNACIKSILQYLPVNTILNEELSELYVGWDPDKIYKKLGIKQRHIAEAHETAVDMAEKASISLFDKNPGLKDKLDFIILCTQSPDYILPTSACILQDRLGISKKCGAFDFNLGCSGFIYGLAISKGLINSGIAENILLIMSETYTKHINPMDKSTRTIFGDGAAAIWIGKSEGSEGIEEFVLGTDGSGYRNLIIPAGGGRFKCTTETSKEFTDEDNNTRSMDNLYMNGTEIFSFTLEAIPDLVDDILKKNKLAKEHIDYYVFHQANKYILKHLRDKIKIPEDKFYINMEDVGNTVSASIPIALIDAENSGKIKKGDKIMLVGFGVGYSWGGCVINW